MSKMKRKVLKVGNVSLAVSLPSKWAKQHGLKAGDEIEITETSDLIISASGKSPKGREISLNIDDFTYYALSRYLTELYREDYNHVTLIFNKTRLTHQKKEKEVDTQQMINKLVLRFIGAEIVSQTKRGVEIEFFVSEELQDLDKIEKRIYFLFKESFTEMLATIKDDFSSFQKTSYDRHDNITKFINFYLRILKSSDRTDEEKRASHALYVFLDKAADSMRHISDSIDRLGCTPRLAKELKQIFTFFTDQFLSLFKKEHDPANITERYRLKKMINKGQYTSKEMMIIAETFPLLDFINIFTEVIITRKLGMEKERH